ncbi:hypothetical protein [Fibrobacter sp.]|uniref:hypothetical protein n=1 Tax=Fibrobacter sp. TaxID=35828 RepID=UPI00386A8365
MTNGDVAAFSACIAIFFIFVAVLVFVIIDHKKQTADHPSDNDFEHQVRIVELENGIFIIQVWQKWKNEWEAPFGPHHYNTLADAKKEKERRIEELKRDAGYRFKRVVD